MHLVYLTPFQQSIRFNMTVSPLVVRWPGEVPAGNQVSLFQVTAGHEQQTYSILPSKTLSLTLTLTLTLRTKAKDPLLRATLFCRTRLGDTTVLKPILTIPARRTEGKVLFLRRQDRYILDMLPSETLLVVTFHERAAFDEVSLTGAVETKTGTLASPGSGSVVIVIPRGHDEVGRSVCFEGALDVKISFSRFGGRQG